MRNVTAGCYADYVKQIRALTEQLSPKIFNGHVEGPNLPFLTRHPCGHCRRPTVWLCCCIGWYSTPFCTSTHVLCVQILKANGWMTCHCWLTIAHRYRSAFGAASLLIMSLHGTRVLGQQGRPISVRLEATCNLACEELACGGALQAAVSTRQLPHIMGCARGMYTTLIASRQA